MTPTESIVLISSEITTAASLVLFHKSRFATLFKRIEAVVDLVKNSTESRKNDIVTEQAMDFLLATLEDIKAYAILFSAKDTSLANRVIIYGSDEEEFIKWNERLQHCVDSLGLSANLAGAFDEKIDLNDFESDVADLKKSLLDILRLFDGKEATDLTVLMKTVESLLGHQSSVRSTYQTKTAPTDGLVIDPKNVKYQHIIGRGGKSIL